MRGLIAALFFVAGCGNAVTGGDAATHNDLAVRDLAGCSSDTTCGGATPHCDQNSGKCVGCVGDDQCPAGQVCAIGVCASGCNLGHGCGDAGACDVDAGICRSCAADHDCMGSAPRCDVSTMRCVVCLPESDNCALGTSCQKTNGVYACAKGCKSDAECSGDGGMSGGACCDHTCVDTTLDSANCGKCGMACVGKSCCASTCIDPTSDLMNCGACGIVCKVANATAACNQAKCTVAGCAMGFADCDKNPANGCEVNIANDPLNCTACGMVCNEGNAMAACNMGCTVSMCTMGFGDCDKNPGNGCEVNLTSDLMNCGMCGNVCAAIPNGVPVCGMGLCAIGSCNGTFKDCDQQFKDGCEVDTAADPMNCGACGKPCAMVQNGTAGCAMGLCTLGGCNSGFAHCDKMAGNNCEVNTAIDVNNCGGCAMKCVLQNATAGCAMGKCVVASCMGAFADCDKSAANGCEVDTSNDVKNCGGCGVACAPANAIGQCVAGTCQVVSCAMGFADCDKQPGNGCEVTLGSDANNCGACGNVCPPGNGPGCVGGACSALPPMDNALVGYWNLDDAGPVVKDRSGNNNNGIAQPGAVSVKGKVGNGFRVQDGACITIPNSDSLQMVGAGQLTMMAWVSYAGSCTTDIGEILNKESTYEMGPACPSGPFQEAIQLGDGNWFWHGTHALDANAWDLVAVTWDGMTVRMYVNGMPYDTRMLSGMFTARATGFGIGCRSVPVDGSLGKAGSFFNGIIDEVSVYKRALSEGEITAYYNATK